jgi:hypothetical protein
MADRNELSNLNLNEFSICFEDLGGPANEDCNIEFVKSKAGLGPVLKETDMSEQNDNIDNNEVDEDFEAFADEHGDSIVEDFSKLEPEDQAAALVGLAYDNAVQEGAIVEAAGVIKSLSENAVPKEKYDAVVKTAKQAGELIEKMRTTGNAAEDDGGLLAEIKKANGGADLSPEAAARIEAIEKAQNETAVEKAVQKAKAYGFGKAEEVADLELGIRKSMGDKKADAFVALVKQAGELAKKSPLFKAIGEDAGNADATSPIAKAKAGAAEIRKANPKLSEAQAQSQYWADNPDEYAAYQAERATAA